MILITQTDNPVIVMATPVRARALQGGGPNSAAPTGTRGTQEPSGDAGADDGEAAPRLDLNLLYVFDAVMTEHHVTRAAERLGMTQSAVSNALARLRTVFDDQLFTKAARGVQATPRARALWPRFHQMLAEVGQTVQPREFDALRSEQRFRIALSDITAAMITPHLYRRVHDAAPACSLQFVPYDPTSTGHMLMRGELDFAIGLNPTRAAVIESVPLFTDSFVVAAQQGHPLVQSPPTLAQYCAADQLTLNETGDESQSDPIDDALARAGHTRRVRLTVNQFSVMTSILRSTPLVATLPMRFARSAAAGGGLATQPLPFAMPDAVVHLSWHRRSNNAAALRWLKERLLEAATALSVHTEAGLDAARAGAAVAAHLPSAHSKKGPVRTKAPPW